MAIKDILLLGDQRLYNKSVPVLQEEVFELMPQIELMFETILDFRKKYGAGRAIAAPQIGLFKRIICLNIDRPVAMINPVITRYSKEMFEIWDDCMSFPDLLVKVRRHLSLDIHFFDPDWKVESLTLEGDMSELIQHEFDHLNGILATQRAIDDKSFKWRN